MSGGPQAGDVVGGYRLEAEAGRGGMGVVFRAVRIDGGETVALKLIAAAAAEDAGFRARFRREARLLSTVEHPHVVPFVEAGEADGLLFVAMGWVDGTDLRDLIVESGSLSPDAAIRIVGQVAGALDAAHDRGLVHRDVKPANILVETGPDGGPWAFLSDFGLTRDIDGEDRLTHTGTWVGSVDYVAPEQIEDAPVDRRADVYALGCVLYELLTGRVPFPRQSDPARLWAHLHDAPPSARDLAPSVAGPLDAVLRRALAKDPGSRWPTAGDFARAAARATQGSGGATSAGGGTAAGGATAAGDATAGGGAAGPARAAVAARAGAPAGPGGPDAPGGSVRPGDADSAGGPARADGPAHASATAAGDVGRGGSRTADAAPRAAPGRGRLRRRGALVAGCVVLLTVVVGTTLALTAGGGDEAPSRTTAAAPDVRVTRYSLGSWVAPGFVSVALDRVFVLDRTAARLLLVDPASGLVAKRIDAGKQPRQVLDATKSGHVWSVGGDGWLRRLDRRKGQPTKRIRIPRQAWRVVETAKDRLMVLTRREDGAALQRVNAATYRTIGRPKEVGGAVNDLITTAGRHVQVLSAFPPLVEEFEDDTLKQTGEIRLNTGPGSPNLPETAVRADLTTKVWVATLAGNVIAYDGATGKQVGRPIVLPGDRPRQNQTGGVTDLALTTDGTLWVPDARNETVTRIDTRTGRIIGEPVSVPGINGSIAARGSEVWLAGVRDLVRLRD